MRERYASASCNGVISRFASRCRCLRDSERREVACLSPFDSVKASSRLDLAQGKRTCKQGRDCFTPIHARRIIKDNRTE